jgi:hypothetical protein
VRLFLAVYLVAWLFLLSIALGSAALLHLHALTGGRWGRAARPAWERACAALPVLALLFVPLLLLRGRLYVWGAAEGGWLTPGFFTARSIFYLLSWCALGWAARGARARGPLAALALVAYFLTATFASVDWLMTLEPRWPSTVYGLTFIAGQAVAALAAAALAARPGESDVQAGHDLGNLMLAFTMLWAYCAFSQYLVIWSGDLPREIPWYAARTRGAWGGVAVVLAALQFGAPFMLLLWRGVKRRSGALAAVGGMLLAARLLELCWLALPAVAP